MDKRKQRTRQYLRDALLELILEQGYDSITVQEITDRANLGRATFYLHFKDKEELLATSLAEIIEELTARMRQIFSIERIINGSEPPSMIAFQHAAENRNLYRVMLHSQIAGSVLSQIRNMIAVNVKAQLQIVLPDAELPVPIDILAQHVAGSLLALLGWWLETESSYTPLEMARMLNKLTAQPLMLLATQGNVRSS
jgi:AcrR family transcriptional regulator